MSAQDTSTGRWFRRAVQLALVALILVLVIWSWPEKVAQVRTAIVARGTVEQVVQSIQAGSVKSNRQVNLRAVTAGRVTQVNVERGVRVEKNQLLVELDGGSLAARTRLSRANQAIGMSALRTAELRRDVAQSALDRNRKLAKNGVLSPGALERFQAEFDLAKEAVSSAEANLAQLKAAVDVAQSALDETRIRAPFSGLVSRVHVEPGEVVAPATALLDLVDDSSIQLEASVDEADLGHLSPGMAVRIEADAYPDQPFAGKLTYVSPVVLMDLRQNRSVLVEVGLDGLAGKFKVGMSADVEIVVDRHDDVLWVPSSAVMRRGDSRQVYVVAAGRARLREFRPGLTNWDRTEVLEGLREGEPIIVSMQAKDLADGVKVIPEGASATGRAAY